MSLTRTMKEYKAIAEGTYEVELKDLKALTFENPPPDSTGNVIKFFLECINEEDDDGNPVQLDGIANDILTQHSKLTRWLAAFGVVAEAGEDLDMEQAVGRRAQATVVHKPGKDGTGAFARVDTIVSLPKGKAAPKAQKPTEEPLLAGTTPISAFWLETRKRTWSRKAVLDLCQEMYGCEPADLATEDRVVLLEAIDAPIDPDGLPFE